MDNSTEYAKMIEVPACSCEYSFLRKKRFFKKKKFIKAINDGIKKNSIANENEENPFLNEAHLKDGENLKEDNLPTLYDDKIAKKENRLSKIISVQVVAVFALISAIILTNVFWENSGMNTLFKSVFNPSVNQLENKNYNDFLLNLPVGDENAVNIVDGSIIIKGEYSIYPVCEGKISKVEQAQNGTFTVTVEHSDSFSTITEGLDMVYFSSGEEVYKNMPIGYVKDTAKVFLYNGESLLTDYASTNKTIVFNK